MDSRVENVITVGFVLMCFFVGIFLGVAIANDVTSDWWRDELVRRGHAQYNQTTGAWEWRDSVKGGGE